MKSSQKYFLVFQKKKKSHLNGFFKLINYGIFHIGTHNFRLHVSEKREKIWAYTIILDKTFIQYHRPGGAEGAMAPPRFWQIS